MVLKLKEIRLPEGDVGSLNIGWFSNGASRSYNPGTWLAEGFDGARFIGAGIDRTVLHCDAWDGRTIACKIHPGVLQFEAMTIYAGSTMAAQFGEQNTAKRLEPKFQIRLIGVKGVVPPPVPGMGRTKWCFFSYQADRYYEDVEIDATLAAEHGDYIHNVASLGVVVKNLVVRGSGAQNFKMRCPANETAWPGNKAKFSVKKSQFQRAGQPWSDRGNGLIVIEGGGMPIEIEDCLFRSSRPNDPEARAIMISSEPESYDWATGAIGTGFGNGPISIKRIAVHGWRPDGSGLNELVRCGPNSGTSQKSTPSFLLEASGVWGKNTWAQFGGIPKGKLVIRNCNTPEIKAQCDLIGGIDTSFETSYPGPLRLIPLSEGIVA